MTESEKKLALEQLYVVARAKAAPVVKETFASVYTLLANVGIENDDFVELKLLISPSKAAMVKLPTLFLSLEQLAQQRTANAMIEKILSDVARAVSDSPNDSPLLPIAPGLMGAWPAPSLDPIEDIARLEPAKILALSVTELELGTRASNALLEHGIATVSGLIKLTPRQLKETRNCGARTIKEIQEKIEKLGLSLAKDDQRKSRGIRIDRIEALPTVGDRCDWARALHCSLSTLSRAHKQGALVPVDSHAYRLLFTREAILRWLGLELTDMPLTPAVDHAAAPKTENNLTAYDTDR